MGSRKVSRLSFDSLPLPGIRDDHIRRPRLTAELENGGSPVIVVVGPAGFGKTTVLVDWLGAGGRPFSWLSLEDHHDDVLAFFTDLSAALEAICGQGRLNGLVSDPSALAGSERLFASAAVEDLGAAPEGSVVVIEDLHWIADPRIHRALHYVVDHAPLHVTLALTSRSDPPIPLAKLRAAGQLTELRSADLVFSPAESEQLLTAAVGGDCRA